MIHPRPITLSGFGVTLEPLGPEHISDMQEAVLDGELWRLWYTMVPEPAMISSMIESAQLSVQKGEMLAWAVRDEESGRVVGSTRYHDIVAEIDRVEIGYTWYAKSYQRGHVNPACKLLLLEHGFDRLGCEVVGFRTDNFNFRSQAAIERLGAKRDGVIRHHRARRDGSIRDSVMYSILKNEWPDVRTHLEFRLSGLGKVR